jgi:hypothetical protein
MPLSLYLNSLKRANRAPVRIVPYRTIAKQPAVPFWTAGRPFKKIINRVHIVKSMPEVCPCMDFFVAQLQETTSRLPTFLLR